MDRISPARRSANMAKIRSRDTKPELAVRRLVYRMGYRYRLHAPRLPGRPDLVFSLRKRVIFVHGCYWHRHRRCRFAYLPKSNVEFWRKKFKSNTARDTWVNKELAQLGWEVLTVWECEVRDLEGLRTKLARFLDHADS